MASKIVYHGTWSTDPPHTYEKPFHAGTQQSAEDRLFSGEGIPEGGGDFQAIHSYEIVFPDSDIDPTVYADPHFGDTYGDVWDKKKLGNPFKKTIPEDSDNISQYINDHEDRGTRSFVIPPHLVDSGRVKHLGVQFR
jgi:hypothetical protein